MSEQPLNPVGNGEGGRTSGGRFAQGNRIARGNPNNRKAQQLRNAVIRAVNKADIIAIVRMAVVQAKNGDAQARAWVADRLLGKVSEAEIKERVEALEAMLQSRNGYAGNGNGRH